MSLNEITIAAAWIAGLAIVALVAAGWRKPARATADPARARRPHRARLGVALQEQPATMYSRPRWYRRVWALFAGSTLALVCGGLIATFISFGAAWIVITLSNLLKK